MLSPSQKHNTIVAHWQACIVLYICTRIKGISVNPKVAVFLDGLPPGGEAKQYELDEN